MQARDSKDFPGNLCSLLNTGLPKRCVSETYLHDLTSYYLNLKFFFVCPSKPKLFFLSFSDLSIKVGFRYGVMKSLI